jgi:L-glutamine-phosphate cytidylyltransferase
MKAIILAAGQGTRLRPLTENKPKCLVNLFGKSLLEHQLKIFRECDIEDISLVKGFQENKINESNITYFINVNYETTNMVESLFCAKDKLIDSVIISYGDIIFENKVLKKLIESKDDCSVIVDLKWEKYWKIRFDDPLDDAESLEFDKNNFITNIGQKETSMDKIQGQYIGLMKFQGNGLKFLREFYENSKKESKIGTNPLNSNVKFESSYMTDLLQCMINKGCKIKAIFIENGWLEVDSIKDHKIYNKKLKDGSLSEIFNL